MKLFKKKEICPRCRDDKLVFEKRKGRRIGKCQTCGYRFYAIQEER